jgi:hypothetical protein
VVDAARCAIEAHRGMIEHKRRRWLAAQSPNAGPGSTHLAEPRKRAVVKGLLALREERGPSCAAHLHQETLRGQVGTRC